MDRTVALAVRAGWRSARTRATSTCAASAAARSRRSPPRSRPTCSTRWARCSRSPRPTARRSPREAARRALQPGGDDPELAAGDRARHRARRPRAGARRPRRVAGDAGRRRGLRPALCGRGLRRSRATRAGRLVSRSRRRSGRSSDPQAAAAAAVRLARDRVVRTIDGAELAVAADTLCMHGDNPNALGVARAVRERAGARGRQRPASRSVSRPAARPARRAPPSASSSATRSPPRRTRACARLIARSQRAALRRASVEAVPDAVARCSCSTSRRAIRSAAVVRELAARGSRASAAPATPGRLHTLPTRYGGEDGPDLEARSPALAALGARAASRSTPEASTRRSCWASGRASPTSAWFREPLAMLAARDAARARAGRIGGGRRAARPAVYPVSLAGRLEADRPDLGAALRPAGANRRRSSRPDDRVRFVADAGAGSAGSDRRRRAPRRAAPHREVLRAGPAHHGAGPRTLRAIGAGASDPRARSTRLAAPRPTRAVGNARDAAAARVHGCGAAAAIPGARALRGRGRRPRRRARARRPRRLAVPRGASVLARPGNVLRFTGRARRLPRVRGASGRDRRAAGAWARAPPICGVGLRRATTAARCARATASPAGRRAAAKPSAARARRRRPTVRVRVVLGPQHEHFAAGDASSASSRTRGASPRAPTASGCRLEGRAARAPRCAPRSSPTAWSRASIQVPPDGRPIVMLADGPTTGGYPKIATVRERRTCRSWRRLVPGSGRVRFTRRGLTAVSAACRRSGPSSPRPPPAGGRTGSDVPARGTSRRTGSTPATRFCRFSTFEDGGSASGSFFLRLAGAARRYPR